MVIVPPEKLFFPQLEKYPASIDDFNVGSGKVSLKKDYGFTEAGTRFKREEVGQDIQVRAADKTFKSDLSSGFRLDLTQESKQNLPSADKLNLSLKLRKIKNKFGEISRSEGKKDLNLLKYLYPNFANARFAKNYPRSGSYGKGTAFKGGTAFFIKKGYNITPWAETVVARIQKNWFITYAQKISGKGEVGISVTVEKNGELSLIKIVSPSQVQSFDQAALRAINLSLPFPGLPDDFPDERLQVYFVFQCND